MDEWKQKLFEFWDAIDEAEAGEHRCVPEAPPHSTEFHIPYLGDYHPMHLLNLYYPVERPDEEHPLPTVIYIHGGGYLFGKVEYSDRYLGWIAAQGYAVMAMNYRLLQETDLRGLVQDIMGSISWIAQHGKKRGFDLSRVLLTGDSAGGHLAMLAARILDNPEWQRSYGIAGIPLKVSALGISCPCAETDHLYILGNAASEIGRETARVYRELFLGEMGEDAPWKDQMSASDILRDGKLPPLFLIGSETESLHQQTRFLLSSLEEADSPYEALIWTREDGVHLQHVFNITHWEWTESETSNREMLDFFRTHA